MHESGTTWLGRAVRLGILLALVMLLAGKVRGFSLSALFSGESRPAVFAGTSLESALGETGQVVVADYFAPWCGPCRQMDATTWRDADVESWVRANGVAVQVNVDRETAVAARADVRSIPTIVVYRDGHELGRISGYYDADALVEWLDRVSAK